MTTFNIDRNTASRLLSVSIRTIDRYIESGKLSSIKSEGRIWLSKEEILKTINKDIVDNRQARHDPIRHVDKEDIILENNVDLSSRQTNQEHRQSTNNSYKKPPDSHLPEIFEKLKEEIAIKDKRLAQASYRIGQLESQLSMMVPKLELENQQLRLLETTNQYEQKIKEKELAISQKETEKIQLDSIRIEELGQKDQIIARLDEELHLEKVNKWIYAAILYVLVLGLMAIWVVLKWL